MPAGTYFVKVKGQGDYGQLGQYTVSVTPSLLLASNGNALNGLAVEPTGPSTPTKGTVTVAKGTTSTTKVAKTSAGDGNSNHPVSTAVLSSSIASDTSITSKTKPGFAAAKSQSVCEGRRFRILVQ